MAALEEQALQQQLQRLEALIRRIESLADPAAQVAATEAIQALMDLHSAALERMLAIVAEAGPPGARIVDTFAGDDLIGGLLLLYGLHPLDLETRVRQALDTVRPYIRSHGGNVEVLGISPEGVVRLRLGGSCDGCPSSTVNLKLAIEEAIGAAAPDLTALEVEGMVERPAGLPLHGVIPLEPVSGGQRSRQAKSGGWQQPGGKG